MPIFGFFGGTLKTDYEIAPAFKKATPNLVSSGTTMKILVKNVSVNNTENVRLVLPTKTFDASKYSNR